MNTKILAAFLALIIIGSLGVVAVWYLLLPKPNPYDFAVVFATGGLGDKSFNDGCYKGAMDAKNEFGLEFAYSTPTVIAQYEPMLRAFASHSEWIEPYKIIVAIGFDQADALMAVAGDPLYKNQKFAIVDMYIDPVTYPNVASLLFNEHEGSALVGALAALYTTTDKLGFVGGMSIPLIHKFGAGYYWGANLTKPSLNIHTDTPGPAVVKGYVGEWANIPAGKALADIMYQTNGTDIIYAAAGRSGLGVLQSAVDNNATLGPIWAIGVDSPQMYLGCADPDNPLPPTVVLTSMLKRVDVAVHDIVEAACVTGTFAGGVYTFNLANGGVGWEDNPALLVVPASYKAQLNMIATGIINGTYTVPQTFTWLA